jgi:hypothetical protein
MFYCEHCGKPLPTQAGLNKHLQHTVACNEAQNEKLQSFISAIWTNVPKEGQEIAKHAEAPAAALNPGSPVLDDMPDVTLEEDLFLAEENITAEETDAITLEEDLFMAEENITAEETDDTSPIQAPSSIPPGPQRPCATVEDADENESEEIEVVGRNRYFEEFSEERKAGATWGKDVPLFEHLRQQQKEEQTSQWGPFDNQEEWELAKWLIENVGQKQTDAFLKLDIVRKFW